MIRYHDLRSLSTEQARAALGKLTAEQRPPGRTGAYLTAWQAAALRPAGVHDSGVEIAVTVPDFLNYARLLNTGQAVSMVRLPGGGLSRSAMAGLSASPALMLQPLKAARTDFWLVAEVLLRYDLSLISSFGGTVMLHSYLADFAFLFDRRDFVTGFFNRVPAGRAGVHTQQLPLALSCLSRWGTRPAVCSFLYSAGDCDGLAALGAARAAEAFSSTRFVGEIESLPLDLQREEQLAGVASFLDGYLARTPENSGGTSLEL